MVNIKTLSNGVKVVLEEIPYVRSISFGIWVKNGSRRETKENNGISHFIEHMLFKGTHKRSAKDIAEQMDTLGGQINAYTTKEYTCYHTRVLDKHFERALDVISDMFLNSKFDDNDIKKESSVIIEEINMYDDSPEELVHDKLQENVWKGSSVGMPILGTANTILNFDSKMLKKYFEENYHNENTVISVTGNFKECEMLNILEKYLGGWKSNKNFVKDNSKTIYNPIIITKEKDIEQVHICICFKAFERDHKYKYPVTVLNTIFGGGMSSRLFQKIREENGLTYSVYSYISSYNDAGIFTIYAGMGAGQTEKVANLIFNEIKKLKTEKISEKLIEKTKEQIISNYIIGNESTVNRMTASGASLLLRGFILEPEKIIEQVENITANDIENVIEEIFNIDNISISAVGKIKGINFDKILQDGRKILEDE